MFFKTFITIFRYFLHCLQIVNNLSCRIFEKYGFPYEILGKKRIGNCADRWKRQVRREEGLSDTRKKYSGRPLEHELTDEETIKKLKHKIAILEQENSYLKKIRLIERNALRKVQRDKNTN